MIRRYRHTGWDVFASFLLLVCVGVASIILLLEANGYLIDFTRLKVEPSSLIVLRTIPRDTALELDQSPLPPTWDGTWKIVPGRHEVAATAPDRQTWRQAFHVVPRRAAVYQSIILYWNEPRRLEIRTALSSELNAPLVDASVQVFDGEIRQIDGLQTRLVTRFSRPALGVRRLDVDHLAIQLDADLHVIDSDGSNDRVLLRLPDAAPRHLTVHDGGRVLGVVNAETVTMYELY